MSRSVGSSLEIAAVKSHDTTEQLITQARRGRRRSRLDVPRGVGSPVRGLRVAPGQRRVVAQLEHLRRARPKPRQGPIVKISLPGKLIVRDYFQENRTSRRPFLLLIHVINFPGRLIFTQSLPEGGADPVVGAELQLLHLVRGARRRRLGRHRQARHRLARGGQSILRKVLSLKVTILIPRE